VSGNGIIRKTEPSGFKIMDQQKLFKLKGKENKVYAASVV
jgi:hypothetical protein